MDYAAVPTETTTSHEVDLGLHPEYQHDETAYLAPHNEETYPQSDGSPYLYNDETSYLGRRSDSVELTGKHEFSEDDDQGLHFKPSLLLSLVALALTYVGSQITAFFIAAGGMMIAIDLNITSTYSWMGVANKIGYVSAAPTAGYLQDMFGRRNILIIGSLLNILGNIIIGTSHGFPQVVAGCAIGGMGSALTELTTTAAMAETVPVRLRGVVLALNTGLLVLFTPAVLYSELLGTYSTWRWCFWICLIWTVVAFVALLLTYVRLTPRLHAVRGSRRVAAKGIDYVGMVLLTVGVTIMLVGLQTGGNEAPWNSATVLSELIIGSILVVVFIVWERFFAVNPLIPGRLFAGQRIVASLFVIDFIAEMNSSTTSNLAPILLDKIYQPTPEQIGLYCLPAGVFLALGAILFNVLITVFRGKARELLTVASIIMTTFVAAQAAVTPSSPVFLVVMMALSSFGTGGIDMPGITTISAACPEDLIGTAIALLTTIRTIGGAIGYTVFYNMFYTTAHTKVPTYIGEYAVKAGLPLSEAKEFVSVFTNSSDPNNIVDAEKLPHVTKAIMQAAAEGSGWAFADSVRPVFYASIPFGVISVVLCLTLPSISKLMTRKVLVKHL